MPIGSYNPYRRVTPENRESAGAHRFRPVFLVLGEGKLYTGLLA